MPDVNIASGEGGGGKYVIFTGYCLHVPRVLARVVVSTCSADSPVPIYKLDIKVLNLYIFINPSASSVVNNGCMPFVA